MAAEKLWNGNYSRIMIANFLLYFSFMLLNPILPLYLSETFGADKQMIGLVLSGYTLTALLVRPFSGYLVDSFPRRTVQLTSLFLLFVIFIGYPIAGSLLAFAFIRTLHGAPFGLATVSNSTVAVDVLHPSRRAEGIGYYGLGNNVATALGPSVALLIYGISGSYNLLFAIAILISALSLLCAWRMNLNSVPHARPRRQPLSLRSFFLLKAWRQGVCISLFAFSYAIICTYIAIYGKEELGITEGTGLFFLLLSGGLIMSRLGGSRTLRRGKVTRNASIGIVVALIGYFIFAGLHNLWGCYGAALVIGLGNGLMFPAFQTMFLNLASDEHRGTANSTLYVSWDTGFGIGVLIGGYVAEHSGYHGAFWMMAAANALGVLFYFVRARGHYKLNRLR